MSRALYLPEAIRAEGVEVKVVPGWKTRGRDFHGDRGVMFHHTASGISSNPAPALRLITEGTSIVPGPLAQIDVGRDLTCWVVASGRANHGGLGGPWRTVPKDSANEYLIGVEVENNGIGETWRSEMLDVCTRIFAAILKEQKKNASWLVAHKEWTTRKIDPWGPDRSGNVNMNRAREQVADYLKGGQMTPDQEKKLNEVHNFMVEARKPFGAKTPFGALGRMIGKAAKLVEMNPLHKHDEPPPGSTHGHPDLASGTHTHETGPAKG